MTSANQMATFYLKMKEVCSGCEILLNVFNVVSYDLMACDFIDLVSEMRNGHYLVYGHY